MSTATKGHIYYIFKVNGADDVYKLGITNDIERRWNQHGVTKVTLVEAYCLGAGKAYKTEQSILKRFSAQRLTKSGEYVRLDQKTLHSLMNELSKKEDAYFIKNVTESTEHAFSHPMSDAKYTTIKVVFGVLIGMTLMWAFGAIPTPTTTQPAPQVQVK
jgi:predicted GIY-YIG superfamily endonuclease